MSSDISRQAVASSKSVSHGPGVGSYFSSLFAVNSTSSVQRSLDIPCSTIAEESFGNYGAISSSPYSDDWTFAIYRKNSRASDLKRNSSWSGLSDFQVNKLKDSALTNEVPTSTVIAASSGHQLLVKLNKENDSGTLEKFKGGFEKDFDIAHMTTITPKRDIGIAHTGAILSQIQSSVIHSSPSSHVAPKESLDGRNKESSDGRKQGPINENPVIVVESSVDPMPNSPISPKGHKSRNVFEYERLLVNKKELNMMAPSSM